VLANITDANHPLKTEVQSEFKNNSQREETELKKKKVEKISCCQTVFKKVLVLNQ
jgi:hypothetical protein